MGSQGITVSGGNTSLPYIGTNSANPVQGMIRINGTELEVFNNTGWQTLASSYSTVSLDGDTQDLLQWARTQRQLELNRVTLIKQFPALAKAQEAVKRAQENYDILEHLVKHERESDDQGMAV
jgi:hypothetical protein